MTNVKDDVFHNRFSLSEWKEFGRTATLDLILSEEYGYRPQSSKQKVKFVVGKEKHTDTIHIRKVYMLVNGYKMKFHLYVPEGKKHNKAFVFVLHEYVENTSSSDLVNDYKSLKHYCDIDNVISRGYAIAFVSTKEVAPDKKYSRRASVIKALGDKKTISSWGAIQAWSWAASKVVDYFETLDDEIDLSKVAVIGHSRGGKTALLAASQDERFILAVSSCSGNSGASLARNNTGETIDVITRAFPYWFCKNYKKYRNKEESLPFDQHQLIGLIAPRYVYVFSATGDSWACPKNELLACRYASQYFNLYGVDGLIAPEEIEVGKSYQSGHIAYHIKDGIHNIETRDWNMIMDYFDKIGIN